MGSSFTGGNKNIVVVIDKEKYSVQEFGDFIRRTAQEEVKSNQVEKFLIDPNIYIKIILLLYI